MQYFRRYLREINSLSVDKPLAKLGIAIALLISMPSMARADGIYMTNMKTSLTPNSVTLLTDPARPNGVQAGDIVEYVLQAQVANAVGGPGVYFTTYVPNGVEVLGAWFVTDATGATVRSPGSGGYANDGWGLRGSKTPFGAPFAATLNSRQNDLSGDTGIFYSTDSRTQLFTADGSNIAKGPTGNPTGTSALSNGYNVTDTFYKTVDAFNLWDADQVNAFGTGGTLGAIPVNIAPTSNARIINSVGQGSSPFGSGSPVAGPQTGYTLDNTGLVGPWQRIQYPGSQIADISDGPATGIGTADSPTVLPTNAGVDLSDASPLSATTNALRWSYGLGLLNEKVYVKVRVRVNAAAIASPTQTLLNFEANGTDNWGSGSKDNPWRYFGPTLAQSASLFVAKEIAQVNGVPYLGGTVLPGATVTYRIRYVNLGNLPIKGVTFTDKLSTAIATTGCSALVPTFGSLPNSMTATVSAGTIACPLAGATVTFGNLPNVVGGNLGALRGGSFTYNVKISPTLADNTNVANTATFSAQDSGIGTPISATSIAQFITNKVTIIAADLTLAKTHSGSFSVGQSASYGFTVKNLGNLATSGAVTVKDALPIGLTVPDGPIAVTGTNAADWSCTALTNVVTCTSLVGIAAGGGKTVFEINGIQVGASAVPTVTNQATISGGGETNLANNSASDLTVVNDVPDLTVTKQSVGSLTVGQTASYAFTVNNIGKGATFGPMTTSDLLPPGLTVPDGPIATTGANAADWTCVSLGGDVDCTSAVPIPSNGSSTFTISTIQINSAALPAVTNQVAIVGGGEINLSNNGGSDTSNVNPAVASNPNVLLVKRITAINGDSKTIIGDDLAIYMDQLTNPYDDNTITIPNQSSPADPPQDTDKWPDPTTFLIGGINGGHIRPGDELDYSIYFLSTGDDAATNVLLCDRIPSNVTFVPTTFNGQAKAPDGLAPSDRGILFNQGTTTGSLSNIGDGDIGQYLAPGISIGSVYPSLGNSCGTNDNGAIVVNLGTVPKADGPGTPPNSYGFVRFRGRVK
jgi:uncharacterized repeat protein (TIGR01451 family)